jgi:hypothetical protein
MTIQNPNPNYLPGDRIIVRDRYSKMDGQHGFVTSDPVLAGWVPVILDSMETAMAFRPTEIVSE